MELPKRTSRPIALLGGVLLLGALARFQLERFDAAAASGATQPFDDLWGGWWRTVMFVLAGTAATTAALLARRRLGRLTAVGLATAVGGIVLARFDPVSGMLIGFVTGMLVASIRARTLALAVLSVLYGAISGALALATVHDLTDGPSVAACALATISLAAAAILLFSARASRWRILAALHRRGRFVRSAWLSFIIVGFWLGLSVDTVRRFRRFNPTVALPDADILGVRPFAADWLWRGMLGVQDVWAPGATDLTDLRAWPELVGLSVGLSEVGDDDLKSLAGLNQLSRLWLNGTRVSDNGLVHLRGLTRLQFLDLSGTQLRGTGLHYLAGLTGLLTLTLDRTLVADDGLTHLQGLSGLRRVELRDTRISGPGLQNLRKLPVLYSLALDGCSLTDDGLRSLASITSLSSVGLRRATISDQGLRNLASMTRLASLDLSETVISDEGIIHLKALAGLTHLYLQGTSVTDAGLVTLAGLPKLAYLDVRCTAVTRDGIERFKRTLPGCYVQWDEVR